MNSNQKSCELKEIFCNIMMLMISNPVAFSVNTLGTGIVSDEILTLATQEIFNLRPTTIIEKLCLRNVIYSDTAVYGHFNSCLFTWEDVNKYSEFRKAVEKYVDRGNKS